MNHVSSPLSGTDLPFNSLFEMPGVLEIGFSGFLSFVGGGMWVLCGGFVGCVILVLSFCRCAGCGGVCICVFLRLGVGLRREVARRFINWISALHT